MPAHSRLALAALAAAAAAITASGADSNALNPFADANRAELSVDFGRRGRRLAAGADAHIPGMVVDLTLDPTPGVAAPALPVYHGLPAAASRALRAAANATDDEGLGGPAARRLAARPFYTRHGRTEAQCANDINTYKAQGYVVASLAVSCRGLRGSARASVARREVAGTENPSSPPPILSSAPQSLPLPAAGLLSVVAQVLVRTHEARLDARAVRHHPQRRPVECVAGSGGGGGGGGGRGGWGWGGWVSCHPHMRLDACRADPPPRSRACPRSLARRPLHHRLHHLV
jgi:hypothetical protein